MAASVAKYRAEGYRKFQLKVGGDPDDDIGADPRGTRQLQPADVLVADANTGWLMHQAARVVRAVADVDVYIEQPCLSYEECLAVRRRTNHPFVLDETIDGVDVLLRAHADSAMDVINLKISKLGGLTKARQIRDLCVSLGIAMTIEDTWGGDITTAAIAHLAHTHARGAALLGDGLQQLRDGEHRRGRAAGASRAGWPPRASRASACDHAPRCWAARSSR